MRNHRESRIYRVLLSGRVPPAGVHEDPAKTVTSMEAARVLEVIKKGNIRHRKQIYLPGRLWVAKHQPGF